MDFLTDVGLSSGNGYGQVSLSMKNSTSDSYKWRFHFKRFLPRFRWDNNSTHLLLRLVPSLEPVGTIRLVCTPGYYKLTRLAVLKDYRRYSFGRTLVIGLHDLVRADAIRNGRDGEVKIRTHSQVPVKGFYAK